ncbi:MAG TPA: hypothetical protein VGM05_21170 [Planctomycetaceae bacterium]|jgi:hypothetical protein
MTDRKKPGVAFWATVVVVVALIFYVAAYSIMVSPAVVFHSGLGEPPPLIPKYHLIGNWLEDRRWPRDGGACRPFFAPIHWIDRRVRRHVWEPEEPLPGGPVI